MGDELRHCPVCDGPECPWWDFQGWDCCKITRAHLTEPLKTKAENLDALASKSQTFGFLDKKTAPSAANTESGKEAPHAP